MLSEMIPERPVATLIQLLTSGTPLQPQRPLRTLRMRDENQVPIDAVLAGKTVHQRNKSSPALTTLAQAGAIKAAGMKRTAFADVSNVVRPLQVARDDSALAVKSNNALNIKPQENTKNTTFAKPAQRPLSVAGIKGFLNNLTSGNTSTVRSNSTDNQENVLPPANTSKSMAKKNTAVFRETEPAQQRPSIANVLGRSQSIFSQVDQQQINIPASVYDPRLDVPSQVLLPNYHDARSDGARLYDSNVLPEIPTDIPSFLDPLEVYEDAASHLPPPHQALMPTVSHQSAPGEDQHMLPVSELEGYWDEEGYEDQYEEEGYTTARSLRTRSDFTTGAPTIALEPVVTARSEQELFEAHAVVSELRAGSEQEDDESWDTSMVAEYGEEIFDYMRKLEVSYRPDRASAMSTNVEQMRMRPNPNYMEKQTEVQWSMRSVLMDWLVQVHHRFNLLPETLFLCVNYIDRFLSCKVVSLGKLQLVGATAIFVAAKYEEINCPSIGEIVYMVDGGYSTEEILKAERFMLSMLQFELGWPGPMSFLRRISKADDYDLETRTLAKYFLEITIMDERFVGSIPSFTAAGAHCLARLMLNKGSWSHAHVFYSGYTYTQLRPLIAAMLSCCEDPQRHHSAIFDKYADKRFRRASTFVESIMRKGFALPSNSGSRPSLPSNGGRTEIPRKHVDVYA